MQLYDLDTDAAEQVNLATRNPAEVNRLTALLKSYVSRGRSTPGPAQSNDVTIDFEKKAV